MIGENEATAGRTAKPVTDMPAGDARREQEQVNADFLAQEAEERGETVGAATIDPKKLEIENEIAVHFSQQNQLEVSGALPEYHYYWCGTAMRGWMVTYLLGIRLRDASGNNVPIWEVVKDQMPESMENRDATGVRRVGDVILLRCRLDRYALYKRWEREQRMQQQNPMSSAAEALNAEAEANRRGMRGVKLHVNDPLADPRYRRAAMQAAARGIARDKFDTMVRQGKIPGFETPR